MERLTLGVLGRSRKENERRLAIHPANVAEIDPAVRERMVLEAGYGHDFGVSDDELARLVADVRGREELLAESDVVILPKPLADDLRAMREGQVLWGWAHCVQSPALTQAAIDRRLTVIAWEAMNRWASDGAYDLHVFHKNNELAGYCSVLHAMQLAGITGEYGRRLSAAVIGFGATGRGAVTALMALGVVDVSVLTRREAAAVAAPIHSVRWITWARDPDHADVAVELDSHHETVAHLLSEHDVVVNCVLQDTDAPLVFVHRSDLPSFRRGSLFVDVSCDEGMGFEWARPTSFEEPTFPVGSSTYYAVDHSPSLLWDSATWEIGEALAPYLSTVAGGPPAWEADETIRRAIEIRDGVVRNPKILSFQNRAEAYPHPRAES